jgi:hypothetical protein
MIPNVDNTLDDVPMLSIALLLYAVFMFLRELREERRNKK